MFFQVFCEAKNVFMVFIKLLLFLYVFFVYFKGVKYNHIFTLFFFSFFGVSLILLRTF